VGVRICLYLLLNLGSRDIQSGMHVLRALFGGKHFRAQAQNNLAGIYFDATPRGCRKGNLAASPCPKLAWYFAVQARQLAASVLF
jgi:hypothetical protein